MPGRAVLTILSFAFGAALLVSGLLQSTETAAPPEAPTNLSAAALENFEGWRPSTPAPTAKPATPAPTATPVTTQVPEAPTAVPVNTSPVVQIHAPSIGVDAAVVTLGLKPDGVMDTPRDPVSVGWYDFSARPGAVGNVVMAAHVDWANYGPAVFWELRNLSVGDQVSVTLQDGSSYTYEVSSLRYYDLASAPVDEIVGPTPDETLTLITCGGSFDPAAREYDQRLVVRATRV